MLDQHNALSIWLARRRLISFLHTLFSFGRVQRNVHSKILFFFSSVVLCVAHFSSFDMNYYLLMCVLCVACLIAVKKILFYNMFFFVGEVVTQELYECDV